MPSEDKVLTDNIQKPNKKTNEENLENLKQEIKKLTYEEAIKELENILLNVQDENISLDKIQTNYIKGQFLIKHCEGLLECVEQEIIEIDPENLNID